ncbi:hypothetical protein N8T08_009508 [Aspergillus melleus]|uniref:Uncharacterized protein n=1 Tax=Aspergillus melleus TaxID=138277 RepID=A0ACC3BCS9_9EURO|nr:hypothetical protein N8T08_009508 [Aspergillus melleus]
MNSRRRNGKPASCEPCRKDKVRCDHVLPVCSRCRRRKIASRCFYHPAPLTRPTAHATDDGAPVSNAAPARATYTPATTTSPSPEGINSQTEEPFCTSATDKALPTGYLGPTSFVATFEDDREFVSSPSDVLRQDGAEGLAALPGLSPYWVHKAGEVLNYLKDFSTIAQLVEEYYNISQAAVIPAPLVLNPLARVKDAVEEWQVRGCQTSDQATSILANTAQPLQIPPTVEANQFYELFTGSRLRLEIIGVTYAIAGRTSMFSLARDRLPSSNCLPLDLADDALVGGPSEFDLASTSVDSKGWNVQSVFQRASWIRVRFLISTFREEILELSLQGPTREMADQLSGLSIDICLMLSVCYLAYLYNDFLIQRLLVQQDPEAQTTLLDVSSTILSTVLSFGIQREHVIDIQRDFIWTVLLYGFPSAGVLTKALQNQARTGLPIPYNGSRSRLIRDLSVFIAHLETMARPGIANHELFARASRVMSSIIDDILEAREVVPSNAPDPETMPSILDGFDISDDLKVLDSVDFGAVFDQWIF